MRLAVEKGDLDLPEGLTIENTLSHPFLSDKGSSSIAFTIPATSKNLRLLGWPDRSICNHSFSRTIPACLCCAMTQQIGFLYIDNVVDSSIYVSFLSNESSLSIDFRNKKIKSVFSNVEIPLNISELDAIYRGESTSSRFSIFKIFVDDDGFDGGALNDWDGNSFDRGERRVTNEQDSTMIYPAGYGVTPFVYLHWFIDILFKECGYNVRKNPFKEEPWNHLVLLNSCADAMCGSFKIEHLLPDMTVLEFLDWLRNRFGVFITTKADLSVELTFMETALTSNADFDLSSLPISIMEVSWPEPAGVMLSCDTSLDGATPLVESIQEFVSEQGKICPASGTPDPDDMIVRNVYYYKEFGCFLTNTRPGVGISGSDDRLKHMGSNAMKYNGSGYDNDESFNASDCFVPFKYKTDRGFYLYVGAREHRNTHIENFNEDHQGRLMVCWDTGTSQESQKLALPALTPYGLYWRCFESYDRIRRGGNPRIRAKIEWPVSMLYSEQFFTTPKLYNNALYLVESVSLTISARGVKCGETILQCITKKDEPHDLISCGPVLIWGEQTSDYFHKYQFWVGANIPWNATITEQPDGSLGSLPLVLNGVTPSVEGQEYSKKDTAVVVVEYIAAGGVLPLTKKGQFDFTRSRKAIYSETCLL